jgi:hypothetical protein
VADCHSDDAAFRAALLGDAERLEQLVGALR